MIDTALPTHAELPSRRVRRVLPWVFTAIAVSFVAALLLDGDLPDPSWRWTVIGVGLAGGIAVWWSRLPLPFAALFALAALRLGTARMIDADQPAGGAWEMSVNIALEIAMCLLVLVAFQYRSGRLGVRDAVDVVAVVIGTGVVAWLAVA